MNNELKYQPGVCNIGPAEIRRRKMYSFIGYFLFFGLLIIFLWFNVSKELRLTLFFPALLQSVNWLQGYYKFCVHFGLFGVFNMGPVGKTESVQEAEFRKKDMMKAILITVQSVLIATMAGIAGYLSYYLNINNY